MNLIQGGLDLQSILLAIGVVMNFVLGLLIFLKRGDEKVNKLYVFNIVCIIAWSVCIIIYRLTSENLISWTYGLYIAPTMIASSFLFFSFHFPQEHARIPFRNWMRWLIIGANAAVVALVLVPGAIIKGVIDVPRGENIIEFGPLYLIYSTYISGFFTAGLGLLIWKYFLIQDPVVRRQLIYLLSGYLIAANFAMATNLVLPYFGIFDYNWLGQVFTVLMVLPVTYAIFKHRLFDVKVIATELLTVILWLFIFVRLLLDSTAKERIVDSILLVALTLGGILLVRSVAKEVQQREEIERLSAEKSEFMTFASHEIRNPITAMRGLASLIVDGTTGPVTPDTKDAAQKILVSGHDVLNIISTYLSKSKMELGQIKYDDAVFDMGGAVALIAEGYLPHAEVKGLTLSINIDRSHPFRVRGDEGKLKEVVGNLIDNSLKYTRKGGITVSVERHGPFVRTVISDTGVGIPADILPKLFQKFSRADAQKANILGTGIGLYLAKTFIETQGGRIWAESDGTDKGSRFIVEFPAAQA
jgi:signal transduction histidine kinase